MFNVLAHDATCVDLPWMYCKCFKEQNEKFIFCSDCVSQACLESDTHKHNFFKIMSLIAVHLHDLVGLHITSFQRWIVAEFTWSVYPRPPYLCGLGYGSWMRIRKTAFTSSEQTEFWPQSNFWAHTKSAGVKAHEAFSMGHVSERYPETSPFSDLKTK